MSPILVVVLAHLAAGLTAEWRADVARGGAARVSEYGDAVIVQVHDGSIAILDGNTGAVRRTLRPPEPFAITARVLFGELVGAQGSDVVAISLEGQERWRVPSGADRYALRDGLQAVETGAGIAVALPTGVILTLDPGDGRERWRHRLAGPPRTLLGDGGRVLLVEDKRLTALEAATGAEAYGVPLEKPGALALAAGRLAVSDGAVVRVVDTATGRAVATFAGAADRLVWAGDVLCSIDGAAVACSGASGEPLWRQTLPLAVTEAVALPSQLNLVLGEERLLAFDPRSGSPRGRVNLPERTAFWLLGERLFTVDDGALVLLGPGVAGSPPLPPYLRFSFTRDAEGRCDLTSADWMVGDTPAWSRPLPDHLRASFGPCDEQELVEYGRVPRFATVPGLTWLAAGGALWIRTADGVVGLDPRDGRVLVDVESPRGEPYLFFDQGRFTWGSCRGPARGGQVFAVCGGQLLSFNGHVALVVDVRRRRETARGDFLEVHRSHPRAAQTRARIPLGGRTLRLDGVTFM